MSSWIKMRHDLADDPAVDSIAAECQISKHEVVGCLHAVWSYFDRQSHDGTIKIRVSASRFRNARVTIEKIDSVTGVTGFALAMENSGWLQTAQDDGYESMTLPNFERHNSENAKARALTAIRAERHRNANSNASVTPTALPDKRREEKKRRGEPPTPLPQAGPTEPGLPPMESFDSIRATSEALGPDMDCPHAGDETDAQAIDPAYQAAAELLGKTPANLSAKHRHQIETWTDELGGSHAVADVIREAQAQGLKWPGVQSLIWAREGVKAKRAAKKSNAPPPMSDQDQRILKIGKYAE